MSGGGIVPQFGQPNQVAPFAQNPLTQTERDDVGRFLGYPVRGNGGVDITNYRYTGQYEILEFRMADLTDNQCIIVRARLAALRTAETQLEGAGALLLVDEADVFKRNAAEIQERLGFLRLLGWRLAEFLGVPPFPDFGVSAGVVIPGDVQMVRRAIR